MLGIEISTDGAEHLRPSILTENRISGLRLRKLGDP